MMKFSLSRRDFLLSLAGLPVFAAAPQALALDEFDPDRVLTLALQSFIDANLLLPEMRCGTCQGKDVPSQAAVLAFGNELQRFQWAGPDAVIAFLADASAEDLAHNRYRSVDGWILTDTEILASAHFARLTGGDCYTR